MSKTVDSRVVEMSFDNRRFERNVQTSLNTLDKLKRGLNLTGATKGLEAIDTAAKSVNLAGLGKAVDTVKNRFSAMEVVAVTALANITNSVINTGKQLVRSLTVQPIKDGFDEYELKMGSVQTIMASTGESLQVVNGYLRDLNEYSDKTIYSFSDMTANIGKFTNAGVKLEDAVKAIQGISNEAAVSGANANEASRAMYNFAQALSAGAVKLIDWKSIENANMATVEFKNNLIKTAVELGTLRKEGDKYISTTTDIQGNVSSAFSATTMFNESLSAQWMTTDVLVKTLGEYADETTEIGKKAFAAAQDVKTFTQLMDTLKEAVGSGWAETWEIVFGDFNETKELWTSISNVAGGFIGKISDARNDLLRGSLSTGWKNFLSVGVRNATEFENVVTDVANTHNIAIEDMLAEDQYFAKTLERGWMTTDILSESINKYTDSLTQMSEEELKAAGYTKEQLEELQAFHSELKNGTITLDEFVDRINKPSGRQNIFESIKNVLVGIGTTLTPIKNAFNDVFSKVTSKQFFEITEKLREATSHLRLSEEASENLRKTFRGLFAVVRTTKDVFVAVCKIVSPLISGIGFLGGAILRVTGAMGDHIYKWNEFIRKSDVINIAVQRITSFLQNAKLAAQNFISFLKEKITIPGLDTIHSLLGRMHDRLANIGVAAGEMKNGVKSAFDDIGGFLANCKFVQVFQKMWDLVSGITSGVINAAGALMTNVLDKLGNANFNGVLDLLNGVSLAAIATGIYKFFKSFKTAIDDIGGIKDGIVGILGEVRNCFKSYQDQLKAGYLLKIASAIAILAGSIAVLSLIDSGKLAASVAAMTALFANLMGSMTIFSKLNFGAKGFMKTSTLMIAMSTSILILSAALKTVASIDSGKLASSLIGLAGIMGIMTATVRTIGNGSKTMLKGATQMSLFATATKILASVCRDLSALNWNDLTKGLTGVGILLAEISIFTRLTKSNGKMITIATGIVALSSAMKILASACADFATMKWSELGKGLTSIGILLAEITAFTKLSGNAKHVISTGVALIAISSAMKIFASAVADFVKFKWDEIGKGLTVLGVSLAEITLATKFMPKNMVGIGVGLIALSTSVKILASALSTIGGFSWEQIAKGLVVLGGAMAEFAIGLKFMNGSIGGAVAMTIAAGALALLTPVLSILGAMSWSSIAKGLVTIAGAFAVLGVSGAVLTPIIPSIIALSGAFTLVGVGILGVGTGLFAAGAGLGAVAAGLAALATLGAAGAAAIVASLTVIVTGVAGLIPAVASQLGAAIVEFCKVITDGAPAIGDAIISVILSTMKVLGDCVPEIADGSLRVIVGVIAALVAHTPQIVDNLFGFIIGVLDGIARNVPQLVQSAVDIIMAFFVGVADALSGIDTSVLLKGIVGVGILSGIMAALGAVAMLIPGAMIGVLGMGAVIAELSLMLSAIGALAQIPGLSWIIGEGGNLLLGIGTAIGNFVGGIVGGFMGGVSSQFPKIGSDLSQFMINLSPFIQGASSMNPEMMSGVKSLADIILMLTATDILNGLTSWLTGGSSLSAFADELVPFGTAMKAFSDEVSGIDGDAVAKAASAGKIMAEMASSLPNTGGVVGFFAGENDMEAFSNQLVPFGKAIKEYSDSIAELDVDAVSNSAIAGKALVELANTLPNTGGVVSWFAGDNNMADFGKNLVSFGECFAEYSNCMGNVDTSILDTTTKAAASIVELQNNLPKAGGLFSDNLNLSDFGKNLSTFGYYFSNYYDHISSIDMTTMSDATRETNKLIYMINSMSQIDTASVSNFNQALTSLAKTGIDGFVDAFNNADTRITDAVGNVMKMCSVGINTHKIEIVNTISNIIDSALVSVKAKNLMFNSAAQSLMTSFIAGTKTMYSATTLAALQNVSGALTTIRNHRQNFYDAGVYLSDGFANAMRDRTIFVSQKARIMARAAATAIKDELQINSPSKVGYQLGDFFGVGFANSLINFADKAYSAGSNIATAAKSGLRDTINKIQNYIDGKIEATPTIRPVLDLSDVRSKAGRLSAMLSHNQALRIDSSIETSRNSNIHDIPNSNQTVNTFAFTQNNYSPKPLPRAEIYRHSKNQFSTFERMIKT